MVIQYDNNLEIVKGRIQSQDGVVGYADYGDDFVYVCFYQGKLVVAEYNSFNSVLTRLVRQKIMDNYYYAFKILCSRGITAVIKWVEDDIVLIGGHAGYYANGARIWTKAADIKAWPGLKEI